MDTKPPSKSAGREIVERAVEAGLGSVPLAGNALAITFATVVSWRLDQRREKWLTELAEAVQKMGEQVDGLDLETLADDDRFVDAVVTATRTIEHTHQDEKISALRNAVLNSAAAGAPDADTQAIFLSLVDRFTPSHLRLLTLLDDPQAWFASNALIPPQNVMAGPRALIVKAGLPEMQDREAFYLLIADELESAQMLTAGLQGMVSGTSLMSRITSDFGRQFVRFISPPTAGA
jgi:hypothetical protein